MTDESATDALSLDRYDFIRTQQREHPADVQQVLPKNDMPALPALEGSAARSSAAVGPAAPTAAQ
jgi:hypothetical protein